MLSYWRSAADLQRFAADADAPHLEPWRRFMKAAHNDSSVGIWHETYVVPAGAHESIYAHLPEFGLGKAVGSLPVGRELHTAAHDWPPLQRKPFLDDAGEALGGGLGAVLRVGLDHDSHLSLIHI